MITVSPSYWLWAIPWSSTWIAMRLTAGSSVGPLGTAQDFITPSTSSRKSQWWAVAWCSWTTKTPAGTPRIANCSWPSTFAGSISVPSSSPARSPSAWKRTVPSSSARTHPIRPSSRARARISSTVPPTPRTALAANRRQQLVDRVARHRAQLVVRAVLDRVGDEHPARVRRAERLRLRGRGVREHRRGHQHAGPSALLEADHVAQTARHAGASVGERLDHGVAALGDLAPHVRGRRLGERGLLRALDLVAAVAQQRLELVEEDVPARLADVDERDPARRAVAGRERARLRLRLARRVQDR